MLQNSLMIVYRTPKIGNEKIRQTTFLTREEGLYLLTVKEESRHDDDETQSRSPSWLAITEISVRLIAAVRRRIKRCRSPFARVHITCIDQEVETCLLVTSRLYR